MDVTFTVGQVLLLLGGKFPHGDGFAWERVELFKCEDGVFQPYSSYFGILPGPGLVLTTTAKTCKAFGGQL